jgi:ABC-type antimicrobial peptide transport system ATPase subunit
VDAIIVIERLKKTYDLGEVEVEALRGIDVQIRRGEFVAIMGASGSGKSTLMNILGCLDRPTSGCYRLEGMDVSQMSSDQLAEVRNKKIGFVFRISTFCPVPAPSKTSKCRCCMMAPPTTAMLVLSPPSRQWDWKHGRNTIPASYRVANSSAWLSPVRW